MSSYDSSEPRSNFGLYVLLAFIAAALLAIGVYLYQRNHEEPVTGNDAETSLKDLATKKDSDGTTDDARGEISTYKAGSLKSSGGNVIGAEIGGVALPDISPLM